MPQQTPPGEGGQGTPAVIGGFELIERIGRGAVGAVYKARQISVNRIVALKILRPSLAKNTQYLERFLHEARAAAQLNHPNIVQAIDAGHAEPYYYFAMDFVDGRSAGSLLRADGPLPEARALEVVRDVAGALAHAHRVGIIHRDIKPDNLLIASDGTVKLADLGLAREMSSAGSGLTHMGLPIGTPDYISPEQARGERELDGRTDIYSLGATLYHFLTGRPPYPATSAVEVMSHHLQTPPPDPRKVRPTISPGSATIVLKAMAKDPGARYGSMDEMLADIERALAKRPAAVAAPAPRAAAAEPGLTAVGRASARHRARKSHAPLVIAAALAAALVVVVATRMRPPVEPPAQTPEQVFAAVSQEAEDLAAGGDYDGAIAAYAAIPKEFAGLLAERTDRAVLELKKAADRKIDDALRRARAFLDAGESAKAKEVLDALVRLRYKPAAARTQDLRTRIAMTDDDRGGPEGRKTVAAARSAVGRLLDGIESAAAKGDFAGAVRLAEASQNDPKLAPAKNRLRATVAVAHSLARAGAARSATAVDGLRQLLGSRLAFRTKDGPKNGVLKEVLPDEIVLHKTFSINGVEQSRIYRIPIKDIEPEALKRLKPKWTPTTPDDHIAAAILALAERNTSRMSAALDRAGPHPLHARYTKKLAELRRAGR